MAEKLFHLKKLQMKQWMQCPNVKKCVVVKRTGNSVNWNNERDVSYEEITKNVSDKCVPEEMNAEDPLFILYTSGSTGKPKGCSTYYWWIYGLCLNDPSIYF